MTTDQILTGLGLIALLAVGSPVLASRLRIPALMSRPSPPPVLLLARGAPPASIGSAQSR